MKILPILILFSMSLYLSAQERPTAEPLYGSDSIPYSRLSKEKLDEFNNPLIYPFVQSGSQEDIVFLIIPGGGYARVAVGHEGFEVAERLNKANYNAYVLFYRVPNDSLMTNKKFVPLLDATQAVHVIKKRHPGKKIAVIGFSAGGHLAATLSNHLGNTEVKPTTISQISHSILAYPVISMENDITHKGSKQNLIGLSASQKEVDYFSIDKQVSSKTPPTFLMHAKDDQAVPIQNTERYIASLQAHQVPCESYIYQLGGHGFGLKNKQESGDWFEKMLSWIKSN